LEGGGRAERANCRRFSVELVERRHAPCRDSLATAAVDGLRAYCVVNGTV